MRQHYVPQFYLKNFSIKGEPEKIWMYGLEKDPIETNIKNTAVENDFYTLIDEDTGEKHYRIENEFSELERRMSPLIERMNNASEFLELSDSDRLLIADYLAHQYFRTPGHRDEYKTLIDTHKKTDPKFIEEFNKEIFGDANPDLENKAYLIAAMKSLAPEVVPILLQQDWEIIDNNTSKLFITSDSPYTVVSPFHQKNNSVLESEYIDVIFPISPRRALYMKSIKNKSVPISISRVDKNFVLKVNAYVMSGAHKFIYANFCSKDTYNNFINFQDWKNKKLPEIMEKLLPPSLD